jgi:hypothetical protein
VNFGDLLLGRLAHAAALSLAVAGLSLCAAGGARADTLSATVSTTPTGQLMPEGFVGVSMEFRAVHQYTGRDPSAIDPVLVPLLQGLAPGDQSRVLRIGGNSTDDTWWPVPGQIPPSGITYSLTSDWMATTRALAQADDAKLILGVNLVAGRPSIAAAEGRAFLDGIGAANIDALEIGNEPNLYSANPWFKDRRGNVYRRRPKGYTLADYEQQFRQWAEVLPPQLGLAGPVASSPTWMTDLKSFIAAEKPRLSLITYHRYPLRGCTTDPSDPTFPSIDNLLNDSSSAGLAEAMAPFVTTATQAGVPFRVAEMNSASCEGAAGVSDTFASALWALDTMFNFAADGVQGVNFHMLPGSQYELFTVSHAAGGAWQAFVRPEYYGLALFAQAFPPGAQLLPVIAPAGPTKVWATRATDGSERVTIINQDPDQAQTVQVTVPGATTTGSIETLTAPSLNATGGVALGGQSFGAETQTGTLAAPATTRVAPAGGVYTIAVAPGSAAMLTVAPATTVAPEARSVRVRSHG